MKDEIKEILDRAKKLKYKCSCCEQIGKDIYISKYHEIETQNLIEAVYIIDKLLDYITNLQKENRILKENAEHNDKVVDNARWNEMIYKSRNKKAIELLEPLIELNGTMTASGMNKLLSILQGEDKDE